ncbi:hypothetical protein [Thermomonas sp.]|uniref:hypothetical protein n=1 Tax=Thermomonas sp. TaxID=1971895 RepID=UPI001EC892AD|nr:hypothetical protein [Thermomonas sp.]MBK6417568.1 hypothetical protein [Thermomonas sp.]
MADMLRRIHLMVGELIYARNFYIALYDGERDSVRFIYFADAKDVNIYETDREVPAADLRDSLTLGLIRHGKPVRGPARDVARALGISGIGLGTPALDFLGVPISGDSGCARRGGGADLRTRRAITAPRTAPCWATWRSTS